MFFEFSAHRQTFVCKPTYTKSGKLIWKPHFGSTITPFALAGNVTGATRKAKLHFFPQPPPWSCNPLAVMCCDKQDVSWLVVKKQKNSCGLGRVSSWLVRKHAQQKADSTVKRAGVGSEMDTSLYRGSSGQVCVSHVYSIDAALFTQFSWCHRRPSERRLAVTSCINCCKNWHRLARAEWAQTSSYCYVTLSTHPLEDTFKPSILSTNPRHAQEFWLISNSLYSVKVAITIVT